MLGDELNGLAITRKLIKKVLEMVLREVSLIVKSNLDYERENLKIIFLESSELPNVGSPLAFLVAYSNYLSNCHNHFLPNNGSHLYFQVGFGEHSEIRPIVGLCFVWHFVIGIILWINSNLILDWA